ncbi:MAG: endonuclease/exonuclease/phosphatase family protein [Rikenellaceae bacterium]|nr:endonuclease/exonuclease/phosphatase family protein [Rikenellaceae bacterium]
MKNLTRIFALALVVIFAACGAPETAHYKIISYNIRVLTPHDTDSLHWDIRKPATITMIEQEQPDIFGLQESFLEQTRYVEANCSQYVRIGVGENDEDPASEVNAIFYLRDKFELLEKKSIWLSETPDTCSRGWDADYNRMATFVTLRDKNNGKELTYINTHFDHVGRVARIESAKMIAERIKSLQAAGKKAIIVGGDFNSELADSLLMPMQDALGYARHDSPVTDDKGTFNNWGRAAEGYIIDHIFYTGVTPKEYRTLDGNYGAPYISDHYPIAFTFEL